MEKDQETAEPKAQSCEPSATTGVEVDRNHRRADESGASPDESRHEALPAKKPGRPRPHWRIRVVRIDAHKHADWHGERTNPFAAMAASARVAEIDAFCARLWARTKKKSA